MSPAWPRQRGGASGAGNLHLFIFIHPRSSSAVWAVFVVDVAPPDCCSDQLTIVLSARWRNELGTEWPGACLPRLTRGVEQWTDSCSFFSHFFKKKLAFLLYLHSKEYVSCRYAGGRVVLGGQCVIRLPAGGTLHSPDKAAARARGHWASAAPPAYIGLITTSSSRAGAARLGQAGAAS